VCDELVVILCVGNDSPGGFGLPTGADELTVVQTGYRQFLREGTVISSASGDRASPLSVCTAGRQNLLFDAGPFNLGETADPPPASELVRTPEPV
jgi:hypothetical protein